MAKTTTKSAAPKEVPAEPSVTIKTESNTNTVQPEPQKPMVATEIDLRQIVTVRNGFQGTLIYKDKRTGADYRWENFGDVQDIELGELRNARGSAKKFFENNWFLFDEDWIPEYLGMGKYYKHALNSEDFDDIFSKPADELEATLAELTDGQRKSVGYRARQLIASGDIDSRKTVSMLERCLGIELVEK